jgi:nondiscriminating glutamyl-tRNA synthetase
MTMPVRTRFAPSPTGDLHVGNLRIAVFNFLFARRHGGQFVLRIEDTDTLRNVEGGIERIQEDLQWAGLDWDEGPGRESEGEYGPYLQSAREGMHRARIRQLLDQARAYPCFCSDEEVEAVREEERTGPGCPGGCREIAPDEAEREREGGRPTAVRFAAPEGAVMIRDAVRGEVTFPAVDIRDFIIQRADGRPTYNFAVVADDLDMRITHVIRGAGHLSNTPKQALLFDAMGAPRPVFAHLPTVLGPDGRKLSKRTGAPGVRHLRAEGLHPLGVVNYLSLLGWSPGDDREVMSRDELIEAMDLERVGASDTMFDPEKLRWLSGRHIAGMELDDLVMVVAPYLDRDRFPLDTEGLRRGLEAVRSRLTAFAEVNEHLALVFADHEALGHGLTELAGIPSARDTLLAVRDKFMEVENWNADEVGAAVRFGGRTAGARGPELFHPVRLAVSGVRSGPDLGKVLVALGRDRTLELIHCALTRLTGRMDPA